MAGGIVEVVLSIGAVTGGALYGPAIWALFSKRQTGKSILWITGLSLLINLFFKFFSPILLDLTLNRSEEMLVGVGVPFIMLACYEVYASFKVREDGHPEERRELSQEPEEIGRIQNLFGIKVLGLSFMAIGALFMALSFWGGNSAVYLIVMGLLIIALGVCLHVYVIKYSNYKNKTSVKKT